MNGEIKRIGAIERKDDLLRRVGPDQPRQGSAQHFNLAASFLRFRVPPTRQRRSQAALVVVDRLIDRRGLGPARRGVVEIDARAKRHDILEKATLLSFGYLVNRRRLERQRASSHMKRGQLSCGCQSFQRTMAA